MLGESVGSPDDVDVGLEGETMVVHGAGQAVVDLVAYISKKGSELAATRRDGSQEERRAFRRTVVLVVLVVCGLNVPRGTNSGLCRRDMS